MDIPTGKVSLLSDRSTVARAAPLPGPNTSGETAAPPPPAPTTAAQATITAQALGIDTARQVAHQINDFLKSSASDVQFTVDSESDQVVVRIVDTQTKEVIRQIPSEEMLAISKSLDRMSGLLIRQKA